MTEAIPGLPDLKQLGLRPSATRILQGALGRGKISTQEISSFLPGVIVRDRTKLAKTLTWLGEMLKSVNISITTENLAPIPRAQKPVVEESDEGSLILKRNDERLKRPLFKSPHEFEQMIDRTTEDRKFAVDQYDALWLYFQEVRKYRLLTNEESVELARQIKEEQSDNAKQTLILHNLRLTLWVARKSLGRGVSYEDLIQEGNIGLVIAADRYDYTTSFQFSTYAHWWVKSKVWRAVQEQAGLIHVPVWAQEAYGKYLKRKHVRMNAGLEEPVQNNPMSEETTDQLQEMERIGKLLKATQEFALCLHATGEEDDTMDHLVADPNNKPITLLLEAKEDLEDVNKELGKLMLALNNFPMWPERNKTIFSKYYGFDGVHGRTQEEIGEEYGITRARTQQIIEKTFELLKEAAVDIDEDGLADLLRTREELTDFISTDMAD